MWSTSRFSPLRHLSALAIALALLCTSCITITDGAPADREWLARHPGTTLRVLVWNIDRAFLERNAGFQQVLRAADADLLILDEMAPGLTAAAIAAGLPADGDRWQVLYGTGGGPNQRASIAARVPMTRIPEFDRFGYPPERIESWLTSVPPDRRQRAREELESGVAVVAGVIELNGRRLLVVGLDLQCCGDGANSPAEDRRQFESRAIRDAIDVTASEWNVDAVLSGGDFNTAGGDAPITIMQRGATQRFSLAVVEARHRGSDAIWTWDGRGTPYPSSRLDYLLHSDGLVVLQAQVFDAEVLDPVLLESLGISPDLSVALSSHRPVVVDFRWR